MHPVDKPNPVGLNENLDIEEDFDPLFSDIDPDSSQLNASEVPNVGKPSEVPNVGKSSKVPNVADQIEMPNVADQTEMPNVIDQIEMPNDNIVPMIRYRRKKACKTYNNLFSIKPHYGGRFTDSPNKQYADGEFCFVDMLDIDDFKVGILNSALCSIDYEDDDELLLYYKIQLKSLDVGLKQVVSEADISNKNFKGYVKNHKIMDFYLELVEKTKSSSDEDRQSDSESEDANDMVDDEHLVEKVEVNINSFNFHLDGEDETNFIDPIQPHVNVTEDDLEILDFDSLESKEFANRDLAKERIRVYAVETRRNLDFKVNDKRKIRVICNGVVPTLNSKNKYVDKIQGPNQDIFENGKGIMQDAKEDKMGCPWLLYLSKGDKSKWLVKTFKDEHKCLQSMQIKHSTSTFLSKKITDLITIKPQIPIKAIQEQMQKKYHVFVSKHKAFRSKAKAQVHLRGDVEIQYCLLRDYANELQRCNPDTTVKIDVYGEEDHEKPTRMFKRIYVCLGALKRDFKENGRELLGLDGAFMRGQYYEQMLTIVGVDANNGIYPVAYDRRKGLVPIIAKLFPAAEHRFYVRHINENMNITWKGGDYKEMLWTYATSTTVISSDLFQAKGPYQDQCAAILNQRTCSYRKWEISDIPCKHAIAAIHDMADNGMYVATPEDWVYDSYKLQTWMNVYAHKINPINGKDMWSKFECLTTLLPLKKALRT
nr:hypothetical protein [Tanacetum cinerariifolium]